jgi:hypothetical protein
MDYSSNEYIKSPSEFLTDWDISYVDKGKQLQTFCLFSDCDSGKSDRKLGHLYISASTGQYNCKKCNASGNLVTLAKHLGKDVVSLYQKQGKIKPRIKKTEIKQEEFEKVYEGDLTKEAYECHKELTPKHKQYFISRGLSSEIIEKYLLGEAEVDGLQWLTIPVFDKNGRVIFFKLRRLPEHEESNPTKYRYTKDAQADLYGAELLNNVLNDPVIITEGELDALVLRDWGYIAVSSTGGAGTFKSKWTEYFNKVSAIFFCFDNDEIGKREAVNHAKLFRNKNVYIVDIPRENGVKDVTDYKTSQKTKEDFEYILKKARKYDPFKLEFSDIEFADALTEFIPAQFFTSDNAYITLQLNVKCENGVNKENYVICSDRRIVPLNLLLKENNYISMREPRFNQHWSTDSLNSYLRDERTDYNYFELLDKEITTLKYYLDLNHEDWYLVLGLWVWGTYFYRMFSSYPYFNINGLMNSGKTKLLELCSELAFNGKFLMGSTPAFVIREIHENCSTIFLDEVESLKKAATPEAQTLFLMLNSGYKVGPRVGKMQPTGTKGWDSKEYDPYSPKMIAGINDVSDTLQSRSINLTMLASTKNEIKNQELEINSPIFKELRDGFYLSVMDLHKDLFKMYKSLCEPYIQGRNWEVWRPLLALAKVIDEKSGQDGLLYNLVRDFALERIQVASSISADDQTVIQLLLALKDMMESESKQEAFYPTINLKTYLKTERGDDFGWLESTSYIGVSLRKSGVVLQGSEIRRLRGKPMRGYLLNLDVINERLKALGFEYGEIR